MIETLIQQLVHVAVGLSKSIQPCIIKLISNELYDFRWQGQ
jgi:hypothetical protein